MKSEPRKLDHHTVLHPQVTTLSGTPSGSTYELESTASDGRVLVRAKKAGQSDTLRWTTQDELTD